MHHALATSAAAAFLMFAAACESSNSSMSESRAPMPSGTTIEQTQAATAQADVDAFFADMRRKEYRNRSFPDFDWQHVDALLAMADSDEQITHYPANPFSSQYQERCSAGILALWFVEGIRKDEPGGYPSLNPMCLTRGHRSGSWLADSENNRPQVASAYRAWWTTARDAPIADRRSINPLEGSGLSWY